MLIDGMVQRDSKILSNADMGLAWDWSRPHSFVLTRGYSHRFPPVGAGECRDPLWIWGIHILWRFIRLIVPKLVKRSSPAPGHWIWHPLVVYFQLCHRPRLVLTGAETIGLPRHFSLSLSPYCSALCFEESCGLSALAYYCGWSEWHTPII